LDALAEHLASLKAHREPLGALEVHQGREGERTSDMGRAQ